MTERSTYIRKIGDGLYEYGWSDNSVNFRKKQMFTPVGWEHTVPNAEAKRAALQSEAAKAPASRPSSYPAGSTLQP